METKGAVVGSPPFRPRTLVMIFDTETTGLLPKHAIALDPASLATYPHILQISYLLFDTQSLSVVSKTNLWIRVADTVEITPEITSLTGITRAVCDQGVDICDALRTFYRDYMQCNTIIAHNINFDRAMIKIEFARAALQDTTFIAACPRWDKVFDPKFESTCDKENVCTMYWGRNMCKIERTNREGKPYFKCPSLSELYEYLFREPPPNGMHNALVDAIVCLRCYVKMRFRYTLDMCNFQDVLQ